MILYGSSLSPYARKVLAFAAEKGIELEVQPIGAGLGQPGEDFLEASPFRKMRLSAPNSANDLAGAAAVATGLAAGALALAVALRADVFAGAGRSRLRFVAGVEGFRLVLFHAGYRASDVPAGSPTPFPGKGS